jgi:copper chaperone CopZ
LIVTSRVVAVVLIALTGLGLSEGCSRVDSPTANTSAAITPTEFNAIGAPTVAFNAPDMMCPDGCGEKVKEILSEQPGAKEVIVDFEAKSATVAIDKDGPFDAGAAVAALVDHGFKNSSVKHAVAANGVDTTQPAEESATQ